MLEREIDIAAPDGEMTTFVFHPEHEGPSPVVLYLMDAPGIRPALKDMAARLASAGYYVMLPNLFYRAGPLREITRDDAGNALMRELMTAVNRTNIVGDARALLDVAADDPAADTGRVGAIGFCMGGGLAIAVAKAFPDQVVAAASIHGGRLVTDDTDSPHRGIDALRAELYFGWADNDASAPPETIPIMRDALDRGGVRYEIDVVTDAVHGYAPPGSERYNRRASEEHWERVHSLFRRNLWGLERPSSG
jgi:carboxymethylenebutenolidase